MPPLFPLEDFKATGFILPNSQSVVAQVSSSVSSEDIEHVRLEGYETGYQAGWDDCIKSETDEQSRIGVEFARNLQDLGFTFHEARSHVMQGLEPLLFGIFEKVLPKMAFDTIGQTILEELLPLASVAADAPIEVVIPPSARAAIEPILNTVSPMLFTLIEEPTLAEGQVFLRSGSIEKHLDLLGVIDRISSVISDLYVLNEKAFKHE